MTVADDVERLRASIDALLPVGAFTDQSGFHDGDWTLLWCGDPLVLDVVNPGLPARLDPDQGLRGCRDLIVEIDACGHLVRCDLEALSLCPDWIGEPVAPIEGEVVEAVRQALRG